MSELDIKGKKRRITTSPSRGESQDSFRLHVSGVGQAGSRDHGNEGLYVSSDYYRNDIVGKNYPGRVNFNTQKVLAYNSTVVRAILTIRSHQVAKLPYKIVPKNKDEPPKQISILEYSVYDLEFHPAFDDHEVEFLTKIYHRIDPKSYISDKKELFEQMVMEFTEVEIATVKHLQKKHEDFYRKRAMDIKEIKKILDRPDPYFSETKTWETLIKKLLMDVLVIDRGVLIKIRDEHGRLAGLLPVDGSTIKPIINEYGTVDKDKAYVQVINGSPQVYLRKDDVVVVSMYPMPDIKYFGYGMSPMETLYTVVLSDIFIDKGNLDYYRKGGSIPEGFISVEPPPSRDGLVSQVDQEQLESIQRQLTSIMMGDFTQLPIISGGKVSWIDFKGKRKDMQYRELAEHLTRKICAVMMVSPQDVGIIADVNRSCYSEDTQTLTENGWKYYWEIGNDERVATLNPDNGNIEFHIPNSFHLYPYKGEMVHFSSNNVNVLVTPDHDMWVRQQASSRTTKPWEKVHAERLEGINKMSFVGRYGWEGKEEQEFILPDAIKWDGLPRETIQAERVVPMDRWLEFLGYVISEGCIFNPKEGTSSVGKYKVTISQKDKGSVQKINECLNSIPFNFKSYISGDGVTRWQVSDKALWKWLYNNIGCKAKTKRLPDMVKGLSTRQLGILLDALVLGDGSVDNRPGRTSFTYYTSSDRLADDVQELSLKIGHRAIISPLSTPKKDNHNQMYRVLISRGKDFNLSGKDNITRVDYDGFVYCFNVPNHLFITRRDGRVGAHGNTAQTQSEMTKSKGLATIMSVISSFFDSDILPELREEGDLTVSFEDDDVEKDKEMWQVNQQKIVSGVLTINQYRASEGLHPVPWGNTPLQGLRNWKPEEEGPPAMPGMPNLGNLPPMPGMPTPGNPGGPMGGDNPGAGGPPQPAQGPQPMGSPSNLKSSRFFAMTAATEDEAHDLMIQGFTDMEMKSIDSKFREALEFYDIHNYPGSTFLRTPIDSYEFFTRQNNKLGLTIHKSIDIDEADPIIFSRHLGNGQVSIDEYGEEPLIKSLTKGILESLDSTKKSVLIETIGDNEGLLNEAIERAVYKSLDAPLRDYLYEDFYKFQPSYLTDAQVEKVGEYLGLQ